MIWEWFYAGCSEAAFIETSFDKKKKNILGLIYRYPHMPINGFCDSFLINCSNKISFLDNTCMLMGDFNIDLHKLHSNNVTSKFLKVMNSCFFVPYIQQPTCVVGSSARLVDNFFVSSI